MACRKCGSGWKTIHGADRASCPECCKQARCRARQQGLIDAGLPQQKECDHCGESFQVATPSEKAKSRYCSGECKKKARLLWSREYQRAVAAGVRVPKAMKGRTIVACITCGNKLRRGQKKYCCNACFVKARSDGMQEWDRSPSIEAAKNRPSNVSQSPLLYQARRGRSERMSFLMKAALVWSSLGEPSNNVKASRMAAERTFARFVSRIPKMITCKTCGNDCIRPARWKLPHCSWECAKKDYTEATCMLCSKPMKVHFVGGRCSAASMELRKRNPVCTKCLLNANKGGDFRKRCRKFGVPYDPKVKRASVFKRDGYRCHICKKKTLRKYVMSGGRAHPRSPTVDHHPYPLSAGIKGHEWDNVRCACLKCNVRKGAAWSGQRLLFS